MLLFVDYIHNITIVSIHLLSTNALIKLSKMGRRPYEITVIALMQLTTLGITQRLSEAITINKGRHGSPSHMHNCE